MKIIRGGWDTLDITNTVLSNEWKYIKIPLSNFQEYKSNNLLYSLV